MGPLRVISTENLLALQISRRPFAALEMTGAAWGRFLSTQKETFFPCLSGIKEKWEI